MTNVNSVRPEATTTYCEYGEEKKKFRYLFFDLSRGYLNALTTTTCDCASIAAKVFVFALPILSFFEGIVDLLAVPFIWTANYLCRGPAPRIAPPPDLRLEPAPPPPAVVAVIPPPTETQTEAAIVPALAAIEPTPTTVAVAPIPPPQEMKVAKTVAVWNSISTFGSAMGAAGLGMLKKGGNYLMGAWTRYVRPRN